MLSVIQTISEEFLVVSLGFWIVSLFNVRVHTTSSVKILNIHVTCNFVGVFFSDKKYYMYQLEHNKKVAEYVTISRTKLHNIFKIAKSVS